MADNDPISDSTPNKRRRLNESNNGKGWDSHEDSGDEFTVDDFEPAATLPLPTQRKLEYTREQFYADLNPPSMTAGRTSSPSHVFVTQPTQTLKHVTQLTQSMQRPTQPTQSIPIATSRNTKILVDRSSPPAESSPRKLPEPSRKAPFAKPRGVLASAIAPHGTTFRQPFGVQSKPPVVNIDSDEEDPPVDHSSDDEPTQGPRSNLKPTNFRKGGRGLDSTPNRIENVVAESPKPNAPSSMGVFSSLLKEFNYSASAKPADDMISAYGRTSRPPRPQPQPTSFRLPKVNAISYNSVDDIPDYINRSKVKTMLETLPYETVQRCFDALVKKKGNVNDAQVWLLEDEEQDAPGEDDDDDDADELSSTTPARPRGIAISSSSQPVRPAAKQEVKAPVQTIAERYTGTQAVRRPSQAEEVVPQPRRRLQQGRRKRSPSPPSSSPVQKPPQPLQRLHRKPNVVSDVEEDDVIEILSDTGTLEGDVEDEESSHDQRLLKFLNDCSIDDLADLTAQPKEQLTVLIQQRPFSNLDEIRAVTTAPSQTKGGKKSKARPIGDKVVDTCSEAWISYDAIDELVKECEAIATPLQAALKSWGAGTSDEGELQLMNLDGAHDSGIGTPTSSCPSDDVIQSTKTRTKSQFLSQPPNMNPEATLKDYQLVGLNWLNLLWSQKISCILADDMGLGKTCQVIAFLAHLQQTAVQCCALIIVPGSTLENWLREFQYFAPSLNVRPYYGKQDERGTLQAQIEADMDSIDVVVTTYDMAASSKGLTRDSWWLRTILKPEICIFDEAHTLRNPGTDRYEKLAKFRSEFRVLLTGTPLQNNLKELVAILGFIRPEMFHERKEALDYIFRHKATTKDPTENAALLSAQRIMRARSMVTPFILRRKKHQVLDLPAKHSRIEYCDMTRTQAQYYTNVFDDARITLTAKSNTKGGGKQSSNILMGLRKAALHPLLGRRVYDDSKIEKITDLCMKHQEFGNARREKVRAHVAGESHDGLKGGDFGLHRFCSDTAMPYLNKFALKQKPWMDSGKVVIFRKLIVSFATNGDRVLVFSQFKIMMDILEAVFQTLNIKFMRLDGSTEVQVRQQLIDTFTNDESITVFMLSTRAGGAGINLAAANKVIIFDSGFNPQDDIQAENRAHRVGQTRDVEVIRLVTRGTIEEQIHALGESKLALDARVAGEGVEDTKAADRAGEQMVEQMFLDSLKEVKTEQDANGSVNVLKDAFKSGLESAGLQVASKQAQF